MMDIFVFGHIPSWAGGRQESGLANVIYQLAKHISELENEAVTLAATDSFAPLRKDGRLLILGWTRAGLLSYMLKHPRRAVKIFFVLKSLKRRYPYSEHFRGLYFKRVFFDKSIRSACPQLVHLHGASAVWYLDLIPAGVRVAVTFHGMTGLDRNIKQKDVLYKMEHDVFHAPKVDEVFFICTQLQDSFIETYGDNAKKNRVIFNSYDSTRFYLEGRGRSQDRHDGETGAQNVITLCTVASLSDLKGQLRVLSGLTLLPDRKKFKYFCIGGDNSGLAGKLEEYAKKNDIDFEYLGTMTPDEIRKELRKADYMIMPSSSEGFGLSYLESIACGVPVILPKNLPIAQEKSLINRGNSILLDDCSAESIAKVLGRIDDFHFDREAVADTISGFSWEEIARQYVNAFKELCDEYNR